MYEEVQRRYATHMLEVGMRTKISRQPPHPGMSMFHRGTLLFVFSLFQSRHLGSLSSYNLITGNFLGCIHRPRESD